LLGLPYGFDGCLVFQGGLEAAFGFVSDRETAVFLQRYLFGQEGPFGNLVTHLVEGGDHNGEALGLVIGFFSHHLRQRSRQYYSGIVLLRTGDVAQAIHDGRIGGGPNDVYTTIG